MSTDEAFDNLMQKKALAIPVARREAPPTGPRGYDRTGHRREDDEETMRVDLTDDRPGDYHPMHNGSGDSERGVYTLPTETELEAVDDEDQYDDVSRGGTRVVGRDVDDYSVYPDPDPDSETGRFTDAAEVEDTDGRQGLELARRVLRFAYLPLTGMDSFESQARDLATHISSSNPDSPSLAITSAGRGEGRTELAIRLALALAKRVGHRVLLVDMDVRKPAIAARLGLSTKYFTMSDVLRGSCQLGEALVASEEDDLYVLPARPVDRDGDEILDTHQVEAALAKMHETFDFVVLDCGPATQADAMVVCRHAGSVALAGRCNITAAPLMRQAAQNLSAAGAKIAGMLITGA